MATINLMQLYEFAMLRESLEKQLDWLYDRNHQWQVQRISI